MFVSMKNGKPLSSNVAFNISEKKDKISFCKFSRWGPCVPAINIFKLVVTERRVAI